MSFDDAGREPDQMFSLNRDPRGELEYPTKYGVGTRGLRLPSTGAELHPPAHVLLHFRKGLAGDSSFPCHLRAAHSRICLRSSVLPLGV